MNRSLKQQKFDYETLNQQRQTELVKARKEISNLESALFNAKAEVCLPMISYDMLQIKIQINCDYF